MDSLWTMGVSMNEDKLRAAAPELLAMLRKLANDCDGRNLGTMKPPRWAVLCEAQSLIARLSAHE